MARRRKPHDPSEQAKKALERAQNDEDAQRMKAHGATVKRAPNGRIISAYRSNVANLLLTRGTITQSHHDAFMRLVASWAKWKGLDGGPDDISPGKIDGSFGCRELVTDRMLAGEREVISVRESLGLREWRLMAAFMVATVEEDRPMMWRGIVERELRVTSKQGQAHVTAATFEQLRIYYEEPRRVAA